MGSDSTHFFHFSSVLRSPPSLKTVRSIAPELLKIWREHLKQLAATNAEGGTVTVDEFKLYKDNILEFKANKVVGIAFAKRPEFIHATVTEAIVWGETNASVALLNQT